MHWRLCLFVVLCSAFSLGCWRPQSIQPALIALNQSITYQTITGWEAVAQAGELNEVDFPSGRSNLNPAFLRYRETLFDQAVNDLGLNRVRLEVHSGAENPTDYFNQYLNGQISYSVFADHRQEIINDNADPFVINPAGFHFSGLDFTVDNIILPLKQRVAARGERLYINLNYVDFDPSPFEHRTMPQEYAEFVLATYQHLQSKYGWVPDAWEVILEPDNSDWTGAHMGAVIAAAAARLQANGFTPRFIAPSTANMELAVSFFDQLVKTPGVVDHLSELSYHRYSGVSTAALQRIASRAQQYGLQTAMLEHIGADYRELHADLKIGRNSAWQQFTLAYPTHDTGAQLYWIDQTDPQNPQVNLGHLTRFLRQYFKYVRAGAVRIEASSANGNFDPLAFVNTDGKYVVVVKADAAGNFAIQGLPGGVYGIKYTTEAEYDINTPDVTLVGGQVLSATIPASGVVTVYAKTAPAVDRTPTLTPSVTASHTFTPSVTASHTLTPSVTASHTPTLQPSATATLLPTLTPTRTPTPSPIPPRYWQFLPYLLVESEPPDPLIAPKC